MYNNRSLPSASVCARNADGAVRSRVQRQQPPGIPLPQPEQGPSEWSCSHSPEMPRCPPSSLPHPPPPALAGRVRIYPHIWYSCLLENITSCAIQVRWNKLKMNLQITLFIFSVLSYCFLCWQYWAHLNSFTLKAREIQYHTIMNR